MDVSIEPMLGEKDTLSTHAHSAGESARSVPQEPTQELTESKSDGEQLADEVREQRKPVVVRNSSFTNKARPVSTASIESGGLHTQGSVKRKDARPPSIMEGAESTASLNESTGSITTNQARFQRRQNISTEKKKPSEGRKVSLGQEDSLSSYSADCIFQLASSSVTCSYECDCRVTRLEERIEELEQAVRDLQNLTVRETQSAQTVQNEPPSTNPSCSDMDIQALGQNADKDGVHAAAVMMHVPIKHCDKPSLSLHSTPFFSDKEDSGYQMCILMDMHMCETEQLCDADLSFSLVIMRGKHDKELQWPFNRNVEFTIVSKAKSFPITVHPKSSKRYERPKSDLNKPIHFWSSRYNKLVRDGWINNDIIEFSITVH